MNIEENNTQLQKSKVSESFYCKYFTEDGFATSDEKCKNQCKYCKKAANL